MTGPLNSKLATAEIVRILEDKCEAGFFSLDLASREITLSSGLGSMVGFASGISNHRLSDVLDLIHPHDRISRQEVGILVESGVPAQRDLRVVTRNGTLRWVNLQLEFLLDDSGRAAKVVGVVADATEQHRYGSLALAGRERLHSLVTGVAPIVWAARADGYLTEMVGWETVTGIRDSKALGIDWLDGIHPEDRDPTLARWHASIERKTLCDSEIRVLQRDGAYRWCRVYGAPKFTKSGNIRDWSGLAIDIHSQVEARRAGCMTIVTGAQIRAARGILNWSVGDLSRASGLTAAVIRRLEACEGPSAKSKPAVDAANALSGAGVEFTFENGVLPGVRPA